MKWKAIGLLTRKTYAEGRNKAELLREMQQKYPYENRKYRGKEQKFGTISSNVFPEEIRIVKVR